MPRPILLKTRFLNNIFLIAAGVAVALLVYLQLVLHPAYEKLLIENAEDEAGRFASYLIAAYHLDRPHQTLVRADIPTHISEEVGRLQGDEALVKLRIFAANGEILFSSEPAEIGTVNAHPYFHNQVAKGISYSKTVRKNSVSAEKETVKTDVVETYVPIMSSGTFVGAIETYYDITDSYASIRDLTIHSLIILGGVACLLLALLYFALEQADKSIRGRQIAEEELKKINEKLESRVAERAGELLRVNETLTNEIAERTLAQMALTGALSDMQESREKLRAILISMRDGLLVIEEGRITMLNAAAAAILRIDEKEAVGQRLDQLVNPAADCRLLTQLARLDDETKQVHYERTRGDDEASARTYQIRRSILRNDQGTAYGVILLLQDFTQEREIEKMKSDFLNMAAHELSTPLASILGYTELLTGEHAGQLTPEQKSEALAFINTRAEALSRIVDDLLDVSRIEAGKSISILPAPFDLCAILRRMMVSYREENTTHRFALDCQNKNEEIVADQIRIGQVLENLFSNAVKYTPPGGEIRAGCYSDGDRIRIVISDRGIGMTEEQLTHIFDKFYRADTSDTARSGVGLGMSIAKHIVDAHGGHIKVESGPGKGTTVTVNLPRKPLTSR